nr:ferrous iron transport protein B [Maliibacterium massiliense]
MNIKMALAGNPNCGKTTMFNALTGSYQYVGNWPGVTVEKKEGKLKGHHRDVTIVDLPGIYSLSPYTLEEVITRDFLMQAHPDVMINIVDASNLERNLYLTTQLVELGIPTIIALNMMDVVKKRGERIDAAKLAQTLGCEVVETSAIRGAGMKELASRAIALAQSGKKTPPRHRFDSDVEQALRDISDVIKARVPREELLRWYAVKAFERDEKALAQLGLDADAQGALEAIRARLEDRADDDTESIITNARYRYIAGVVKACASRPQKRAATMSDKIDRVVTNRWLALPIFFAIMYVIYYVSISTVGDMTIGWVEALFGWIGEGAGALLASWGAAAWTQSLVVDGIIGSIGAIFTFVPQLMILFFFLSLLEDSGYMARVAFIMDRIFRKFGLSGKSFIPMLIGTGCSIPGVMASRTIENEKDRKMTIMLTPFIPCGAKLPVFAMFIALVFPDQPWVGPAIYLIAIVAVILSGIILKHTRRFSGDPTPFVMELPEYKLPRLKGVAIHMWERARSFIKKAGSIIFIACALLWVLQNFNFAFQYIGAERIDESILAGIGNAIRWIFIPLGFGDTWAAPVATVTGLIAKEVVVATFASVGSVTPIVFTQVTAFAFMIFTIFAAPCFAAIGAMHREFGNWKDTLFAICYQTGTAYVLAMLVNLVGGWIFSGTPATAPQALDIGAMEEAAEGAIINGDIVLYVFGAVLLIALAIIFINKVRGGRRSSPGARRNAA